MGSNMGLLAMRINMVCVYNKVFTAVNYWLPKALNNLQEAFET